MNKTFSRSSFIAAVWTALAGYTTVALANNATSLTRSAYFEYDLTTGLLSKEVVEAANSNLCLVMSHAYDDYGNKTSLTTRNCNASSGEAAAPTGDYAFTSRTTTSSFGSTPYVKTGTLPTKITNALNQSEVLDYEWRFSTPISYSDPNGLKTTWSYDGQGRMYWETRPDGTFTINWFYMCSGTSCPTGAKHYIRTTTSGYGGPERYAYYDSLNRVIRTSEQGFDGITYNYVSTRYDLYGRVAKVSKPCSATDDNTCAWTSFTYDALDRVIQIDEPSVSGNAQRTKTVYKGFVTEVEVSNAGATTGMPGTATQKTTITRNSRGEVVKVLDPKSGALSFVYDAFGNRVIADAGGAVTKLYYDGRSRKTKMVDPDMGTWTYVVNPLGEVRSQTDANVRTSAMTFDLLGRTTQRSEVDLVSDWTYDACTTGIGKLCKATTGGGYSREHGYDTKGRPTTVKVTADTTYLLTTTYNTVSGLPETLTYPTGFSVKNVYNSYGHLERVQNNSDGTIYWWAKKKNQAGQVTEELLGNSVLATTRSYDALYRLTATNTSLGNSQGTYVSTLNALTYGYDPVGNLISRGVTQFNSFNETFTYDTLNRLTQTSGAGLTTRSFAYDAVGNLTSKSDAGTYNYPAVSATRPHSVVGVTGGAANTVSGSYGYDNNGNLTVALGTIYPVTGSTVSLSRTLTYTSYNMPDKVTHVQGSSTYTHAYGYNSEHERMKLVTTTPYGTRTNIYVHPTGAGSLGYEKVTKEDGVIENRHYVHAGSGLLGVYVTKSSYISGYGPEMRYFHGDHLGSISAVVLALPPYGAVTEPFSYEAYGERRNSLDGITKDRTKTYTPTYTDRGFTAHEHLNEMNLIHMNGRIFDPVLGRFLTADPTVPNWKNLQDYNRYSYARGNPLKYVDLSGKEPVSATAATATAVTLFIKGAPTGVSSAMACLETCRNKMVMVPIAFATGTGIGILNPAPAHPGAVGVGAGLNNAIVQGIDHALYGDDSEVPIDLVRAGLSGFTQVGLTAFLNKWMPASALDIAVKLVRAWFSGTLRGAVTAGYDSLAGAGKKVGREGSGLIVKDGASSIPEKRPLALDSTPTYPRAYTSFDDVNLSNSYFTPPPPPPPPPPATYTNDSSVPHYTLGAEEKCYKGQCL